jgi:hypothetical protein
MSFKWPLGVLIVVLWTYLGFGQEKSCPAHYDLEGLLQFLREHRSNSLDADPQCVRRAFAELGDDKKYTEALIDLLDFERNTKGDEKLITRGSQYPAINALAHPFAVPYLIKVIKENDNEVVRLNASEALEMTYSLCITTAISILEKEASKPEATADQQVRLRNAEKYINERFGPRPCKTHPSKDKFRIQFRKVANPDIVF